MSKCFSRFRNKVHAILNWPSRHNHYDAIVCQELNPREEIQYEKLKEGGLSDSVIFNKLFPAKLPPRQFVTIELKELTKPQLVRLIHERLKTTIPTLKEMSTEDLRRLFCSLK